MLRAKKIIVLLVVCLAAAMTVRFAHNSWAWHRVLMFASGLQWWPSMKAANTAALIAEGLLTAIVAGAFTTLLAWSARLSAATAAALLSAAVFMGINDVSLVGELDDVSKAVLAGYLKLTAVFFLSGWLLATIATKLLRRKRPSRTTFPSRQ